MILKRWLKQKQVAIKQKTKLRTEASYFALKVSLNSTIKKRIYNKEFESNLMFLNTNKRGVIIRSGRVGEKLISGVRTFIRHLRVR